MFHPNPSFTIQAPPFQFPLGADWISGLTHTLSAPPYANFTKQLRGTITHGPDYSKADRMAYRISVLHDVIFKMRNLLHSLKDLGVSLTEPSSLSYAQYIMNDSAQGDWDFLPAAASTAVAVLWKDPVVIDVYHRQGTGHNVR